MRILITGATGTMGRRLVARLVGAHQVLGLSRRADAAPGCPVAVGDLRDPTSIIAATAGCQAVIHCALPTGAGAAETLAAAPAALTAGLAAERIGRLVVVSTGAGWSPVGGETAWSRAVRESAADLLGSAVALGCHAVGLAPGLTGGLGRVVDTPAATLPDALVSVVSPGDVAGAAEGALYRGAPGTVYPLPGHTLTLPALRARLLAAGARPSGGTGLAPWLAMGGIPGPLDGGAAAADLGWWTRSLERTLSAHLERPG